MDPILFTVPAFEAVLASAPQLTYSSAEVPALKEPWYHSIPELSIEKILQKQGEEKMRQLAPDSVGYLTPRAKDRDLVSGQQEAYESQLELAKDLAQVFGEFQALTVSRFSLPPREGGSMRKAFAFATS
ncbi:MAG: hypothetical protein Q9198_006636 [Flavoplaca austrocitrina]